MANFFVGLVYSLLFLSVLFFIEIITRKRDYPRELTRKLAHMLSGLFAVFMGFILTPWVFITFAIIFFLIIGVSYLINFFTSIHGVRRKTYGELLLPLGILTTYLISGGATLSYFAAVMVLTISDPVAGIIGNLKSTPKLPMVDMISFFISTFVILLIFFQAQPIILLFVFAIMLAVIEKISPYGLDNFSIPVVGSLLLKFLL